MGGPELTCRPFTQGNHVSSEMTPQTVALLHGLKAVFAPIPMFFDRDWQGESLQKFFNPGPVSIISPAEVFIDLAAHPPLSFNLKLNVHANSMNRKA